MNTMDKIRLALSVMLVCVSACAAFAEQKPEASNAVAQSPPAQSSALEVNPKDAGAYYNRGNAELDKGDFDGAIADYNRVIELDPKFTDAYGNRGFAKHAKGDLDGAIADYTRAIELGSTNPAAYNNRGAEKLKKGDFDGAITDCNRAIELDPEYANAYAIRAYAKDKTGDSDGAMADLGRAIKLNPKASLEEKYFETRDEFIRQFSTPSSPEANSDEKALSKIEKALSKLEKQLQLIIGPVDVAHFPKRGKINLETLRQDAGFGQVDGLRFGAEFKLLFVTTTGLLNAYLQQHKEKLPTELGKLAKTEEFYSLVFDWDAAVTHFAEVPVRTTNDKSFAYAFLGLWGQDIGPSPPKHLFVFFANGDRVFVVSTEAKSKIDQIAECKDVWDNFKKKSDAASAAYRASELKDQKAIDDQNRYEEEGFRAYCRCFEQRAKMEPFFKPLTEQAQSIVDNLQKQLPR
jgi:tetratricopeptide (TPR) repeat protein